MAKMKRNIGELVSGKIGNIVFVQMGGKSYVRAAPNRENANWTPQQLLYRQRFASISALWRSIKSPQMQQIWNLAAEEMNGYAWFIKKNMPALAIDGALIDPTLLLATDGKLRSFHNTIANRVNPLSNVIEVDWLNDFNLPANRHQDSLMAMTLTEGVWSAITPTGLKRSDQTGSFDLPLPIGEPIVPVNPITLFLFMQSPDGSEYTQSQSFSIAAI